MRRLSFAASTLCFAAIGPYASSIHNYFAGDDFGVVQLFASKPPSHFLTLFTHSWIPETYGAPLDEFRPFAAMAYRLGTYLGGGYPWGHHIINLGVHMLNAVLVFGIAMVAARLTFVPAVFAGVIFAVLPIQVEAVAWISGIAEQLYAMFCLGTVLFWAGWRRTDRGIWYALSLVCLFGALFSKQNAVLIFAILFTYDVFIERLPVRTTSRARWLPYVPVLVLTGSCLLLRYLVFSDALRSTALTVNAVLWFAVYQAMYVVMLLSGNSVIVRSHFYPAVAQAAVVFTISLLCYLVLRRASTDPLRKAHHILLYFGPIWWLLTTAPMLVAGYATARHLHVTLAGVAVLIAALFDVFCRSPQRSVRVLGRCAALALIICSLVRLHAGNADWAQAARISSRIVRDLEREAMAAPSGTLLLLDAPPVFVTPALPAGPAVGRPWIWGWAMPFAAGPPFASTVVLNRVGYIVASRIYCCPNQWQEHVHNAVKLWAARSPSPIRVLHWDATTGALRAWSDAAEGQVSMQVRALADVNDSATLNENLAQILGRTRPPL
jgi:hypothetical protein